MKHIVDRYKNLGENDRIVYKNVLGAFIVKGAALFVTLYTLPAYIRFFNDNEILGLWFTILSLLNWILNFDLGIGNGLRNYLSASLASHDKEESRKLISSAYFSIGIVVLFSIVVFPFLTYNLNYNRLLNIDAFTVSEKALYQSMIIVFVGVMLQFWLKLINSVLYAMQKSSLNNFLVLCTNLLILVYVKFAPSSNNDVNIIVMSVVHGVAVLVPLIWATVDVFCKRLSFLKPSIKYVSKVHIKKVLTLGGVFFLIQIAYMLIMSTNEYLISVTTNNTYVIDYQAYYKLFTVGGTIFALTLTPIWSVITKAQSENNINWIKKTYIKFIYIAAFFSFFEFILIIVADPIVDLWLGDNTIDIDLVTCVIFAVFGTEIIFVSLLSSIANGLGKLKTQSICYGLGAIIKIPVSILLVRLLGSWHGVIIANTICLLIYCIAEPFALFVYFRKYQKFNIDNEHF